MTTSLFKTFVYGTADYIARHNNNYTAIEAELNRLASIVGGSVSLFSVPAGLAQIFDRRGIIGETSFVPSFTIGPAPGYELYINSGAYWSGAYYLAKATTTIIPMADFPTGGYQIYLDAAGVPNLWPPYDYDPEDPPPTPSDFVWSFSWDADLHIIEGVGRASGVYILFDGDDYQGMLGGVNAPLGGWSSVTARLNRIEGDINAIGGYYSHAAGTSGLNFNYNGGKVRNDNVISTTPDGSVLLEDDALNYIELDPTDGTVSANIVGFTEGFIPLHTAYGVSGDVVYDDDWRTWASLGGGEGGGGGHTQNTDIGTVEEFFTLHLSHTGTPNENCGLEVERGDEPNVNLRWNETLDRWQYTNDGEVWLDIGQINYNLGGQLLTKLVSMELPPKVLEEIGRGSSSVYELLDLSTYITAPQGVEAVLLQVFFHDSAPDPAVNIGFRKGGTSFPATEGATSYMAQYQPVTIMVPVDDDFVCEYFVNASGADTANVTVWLVGYFEKIVGVGTQHLEYNYPSIVVAASSNEEVNGTNFLNRGQCHYLKVEETGGLMTGTYDIEMFSKDTFLAADLLYQAVGIDPSIDYEDWLMFWMQDDDETAELHVKITNNDASQQGTFTVTLKCERFA